VVAENNSNHIAIVPGGWVEEYLEVIYCGRSAYGINSQLEEYLKLTSRSKST
jgi:hypothetical protein